MPTDTPSRADENPELIDIDSGPSDPTVVDSQDRPPDGVLIMKIKDDNGIRTEVAHLGNVEATEVQTLIELGLKTWRAKIGLSH